MNPLVGVVLGVSLALGYALGCVPWLNENLHWNFWLVVPVSGLLFGMGLAWVQFWGCALLGIRVDRGTAILLAIGAVGAYLATDYGIYHSTSVDVTDSSSMPDGTYALSDLITFGEYMQHRLGSSSVTRGDSRPLFEMGTTATTLSFVVDLAGAGLGAFGLLKAIAFVYPFCRKCNRLKKKTREVVILPPSRKEVVEGIVGEIAGLCRAADFAGLSARLDELAKAEQNKKSSLKIHADERTCALCGEKSIIGRMFKKDARGRWDDAHELRFEATGESSSA